MGAFTDECMENKNLSYNLDKSPKKRYIYLVFNFSRGHN